MRADYLIKEVKSYLEFVPHSRIHKLKTMGKNCFIKRDDELSFGVSGTKLRKYSSLIPFLKSKKIKDALLMGTPYSNHLLSLAQLLIENEIKPTLFLLKNRSSCPLAGNFLLLSLFIPASQIHWIDEADWPQTESIARKYGSQFLKSNYFIIPQGAYMVEAFPGALTLPLDILANEKELGSEFSHVFIEAGTGLSAFALILAFAWLKKKAKIHVILLADTSKEFTHKLEEFRSIFNNFIQSDLSSSQLNYELYPSNLAPSFGSTNASVFKEILFLARNEGFLADPLYSAKLFSTTRGILYSKKLTGNSLLIHSGGGLALMGFEKQLQKALNPA